MALLVLVLLRLSAASGRRALPGWRPALVSLTFGMGGFTLLAPWPGPWYLPWCGWALLTLSVLAARLLIRGLAASDRPAISQLFPAVARCGYRTALLLSASILAFSFRVGYELGGIYHHLCRMIIPGLMNLS